MRDTCTDESAISNDNRTAYAAARIANLVLSIKSRRGSISCRTLEEPLRQIVTHSSEDPSVIVAKVTGGTGNFGYYAAQASIAISSKRASSIRRKSHAQRCRMQRPSQA